MFSANSLKPLSDVMTKVVSVVNFIRSRGLNHGQFQTLFRDLQSEFGDVLYHSKVRWLSSTAVLQQFWALLDEIKLFLQRKDVPCEELNDEEWLDSLAFLTNMTRHLSQLNIKLQEKGHLIHEMYDPVKAFKAKLELSEQQVCNGEFDDFPLLQNRETGHTVDRDVYACILKEMINEIQSRFQDFEGSSKQFR